jgi:FKBP-type peptidyl-prolyl cis-trans isomerase FkpA
MAGKVKFLFTAFIIIIAVSVVSCTWTRKYEKQEEEKIQNYLLEHSNQSFVKEPSGLYYYEVTTGTGLQPEVHDTVYVKYTGKYLDGTIFDTNVGKSDTLIYPHKENWVIEGFDEGISYMKVGGTSILLIPSYLAYGNYDYRMPAYTPVIFELNLVKVVQSSGEK